VIEVYLRDLSAEMGRRGVRGRVRRRILAEVTDHLHCDETAVERFGAPPEIAAHFADQLGSAATVRSVRWGFAALAVAGVACAMGMTQFWLPGVWGGGAQGQVAGSAPATVVAFLVAIMAAQVSLVAGGLGLLRTIRRRRTPVLPSAEVAIIRRRMAVALVSGLVCMSGLAYLLASIHGVERVLSVPESGEVLLVAAGAAAIVLAAAWIPVMRASRIRVEAAGTAGDVFDDLGRVVPSPLRGHPWVFAGGVAALLGIVVLAAGIVVSDGYDGALRAMAEVAACLAGFALLGRYLGLRR
jgi:hypothetical protein